MKLFRLLRTTRQFHPVQIRHKIVYELKKARAENTTFRLSGSPAGVSEFHSGESLPVRPFYQDGAFTFLNRTKIFSGEPDWNFSGYGALWNICLNSFEYLQQPGLDPGTGLSWMKNYAKHYRHIKRAFDAHCVSRRLTYWLNFIARHHITDPQVYSFLHHQAEYLASNPEWHLRNNHLLENGFALLRAGLFFRDDKLYLKGEDILMQQLPAQILSDGAHVELSPMYHSIVLSRVLDSISLLRKFPVRSTGPLMGVLRDHAARMCGWLKHMTFENGEVPQVNDSASDFLLPWPALFQLANQLELKCHRKPLGESGYRKFHNRHFELLADVNGLFPSHAPGHAHADALHFILEVFGSPFIIDTGVSTYEAGPDRDYERSTRAHNTVVVNGKNQSEVFGRFRAGRKAKVNIEADRKDFLCATHDGYKSLGTTHTRSFEFAERDIVIRDVVKSTTPASSSAYLHIDKRNGLTVQGNTLHSKFVKVSMEGAHHIELNEKWTAPAFGVKHPAWEVKIDFSQQLTTRIFLP